MSKKEYDWLGGAELLDHTRRKLKVVREYFKKYIRTRCQLPQQTHFRFAVVDGFSGGGSYANGHSGSPLIFLEEVISASKEINEFRALNGFSPLKIYFFAIFNDLDKNVTEMLRPRVNEVVRSELGNPFLELDVQMTSYSFEMGYPIFKELLNIGRHKNVVFNLDQCGHSHVDTATLRDIMLSFPSPEIFYTVVVSSFLSFLQKTNAAKLHEQFKPFGINIETIGSVLQTNQMWLGAVEKLLFNELKGVAPHFSPFSVHNPAGWSYWLIHFVKNYRGREVYNSVLHENSSSQAHFGRSGLRMLDYNPMEDGKLFLFDQTARQSSKEQLMLDIPRHIEANGDVQTVSDFLDQIYSETPAHGDDIRQVMIENPDIDVLTTKGAIRRSANGIRLEDIIKLKPQHSFFFLKGKNR